ncbi:MAG TPA: hypothetical protein VJ714_00265 [Anaerolineae bacterium]|nr:hypothetical protein [Anaerolineae bacterium]
MARKCLVILTIALAATILFGCSVRDMLVPEPAATLTPTKTFVPTFTSTPVTPPSPTSPPEPTSTPVPTTPPPTPTVPVPPTSTPLPPTATFAPRPPAATATPKPPPPTNTPQPVYEYEMVQAPQKIECHPGTCVPAISGEVQDAQGNPVDRYAVTIKLNSPTFGVLYCAVGDTSKMLQPGQFKFESPDGRVFGDYTLSVVRSQGDPTPLSQPYQLGGVSVKSNHWGIIFRRK